MIDLKQLISLANAVYSERHNLPLTKEMKDAVEKSTDEEKCEMEIRLIQSEYFYEDLINKDN